MKTLALVTEIVLGRQPASADQTPNQKEYTLRGPPRNARPPPHGARAPRAIPASDAITHIKHRKTAHVHDAFGHTSLARAFRGRVGARHNRLDERCVDERTTRSTDMHRDMALGCGSVLSVTTIILLVKVVGGIRRTAGGEHARRGAAGRTPIAPFARRRVDREYQCYYYHGGAPGARRAYC